VKYHRGREAQGGTGYLEDIIFLLKSKSSKVKLTAKGGLCELSTPIEDYTMNDERCEIK
jgi:hypothetical protein